MSKSHHFPHTRYVSSSTFDSQSLAKSTSAYAQGASNMGSRSVAVNRKSWRTTFGVEGQEKEEPLVGGKAGE